MFESPKFVRRKHIYVCVMPIYLKNIFPSKNTKLSSSFGSYQTCKSILALKHYLCVEPRIWIFFFRILEIVWCSLLWRNKVQSLEIYNYNRQHKLIHIRKSVNFNVVFCVLILIWFVWKPDAKHNAFILKR